MPPKKKNDLAKAAKMADKENLARAETEILSLQHLLELRSHEALEARRSERMWRERMEAFTQALEQQKEDTLDITADMMRQYKGMQEQLLKKVADLETENRQFKKTIEERDSEIAKLQMEKEQQKRASDLEILQHQHKMEEMQVEFAQMLRETLDKMHERLSNGTYNRS
ncbi:hypothetical protein VOLCADRAFT_90652 [Volvox carteri f. nagariensis]|uniref:Dynein regulatory complex protein 12 n=1 Tax=Volvox carteri f. nagariensis TaxID=3068 RepID=D8TUZ3_VOLCA|nr:uncharacterized protein VOLCADRAFT_90652 [Volvox carteri f. nagariensis]EFJ48904.1 hypothetical protein VOLCADRAFT_90652 [Volvox carteri f. nagariensis]|eukprot:XP_002950236.1 hypothetical protein VOLCADRAFT_90652 [Volvox carteri f. nagariensis]